MITTLLALAALLSPQDPAAAQDPPAAAAATPAAPTETPASVRAFLVEAESHLYDPQAAGLSSLEFDLAVNHPAYGDLGVAHVTWSSTGGMVVNVTLSETAKLPAEVVQSIGQQMGTQFLGYVLNKPITPMLDESVATMAGVEDGLVKVSFTSEAALAQGLKEHVLLFDEDGFLKRMHIVSDMGGTKVSVVQFFEWKPVAEGREDVIAGEQRIESTVETPMGPMKVPGSIAFTYLNVGELVLATSISNTQDVPMQGKMTQTLAAMNLVVNGKAAAPETPATPAGG